MNLNHFWEGKSRILAFPIFILLAVVFLVLVIICIVQINKGFKEKFIYHNRNWTIGIMTIGLILIFIKPRGLINFDKLEGIDLFIAQREGVANCMTIFKIKPNNKFKERRVCFGVSEIRGNYEIRNDTIFFSDVNVPRGDKEYYKFAILQKSKYRDEMVLFRYQNQNDTIGHELWITKNELIE